MRPQMQYLIETVLLSTHICWSRTEKKRSLSLTLVAHFHLDCIPNLMQVSNYFENLFLKNLLLLFLLFFCFPYMHKGQFSEFQVSIYFERFFFLNLLLLSFFYCFLFLMFSIYMH